MSVKVIIELRDDKITRILTDDTMGLQIYFLDHTPQATAPNLTSEYNGEQVNFFHYCPHEDAGLVKWMINKLGSYLPLVDTD